MQFRPVYLHFLDRELTSYLGFRPLPLMLEELTRILLIVVPTPLYCGLSPSWEILQAAPTLEPFLSELVRSDQLQLLSHYPTLEAFIVSRPVMYGHDQENYGFYFNFDGAGRRDLRPTHFKDSSATAHLDTALMQWGNIRPPAVSKKEIQTIQLAKAVARTVLAKREEQAITYALFKRSLTDADPTVRMALRRQISLEYTSHYLDFGGGEIATGIRYLDPLDILSTGFPYYDVEVLKPAYNRLGLGDLYRAASQWTQFLAFRGSPLHRMFAATLRVFLAGVAASHGWPKTTHSHFSLRIKTQETLTRLLDGATGPSQRGNSIDKVFDQAVASLREAIVRGSKDKNFEQGVLQMQEIMDSGHQKVLIIVATDREIQSVMDAVFAPGQPAPRRHIGNQSFVELGSIGGCDIFLVRCEMGSGGVSGSQSTVTASIKSLQPSAVIMVGIAFGLQRAKQKIGDILVSKQILPYELSRLTAKEGVTKNVPRGDRPQSSPRLLARFRDGRIDWKGQDVHFGLIMSGEKLVDSKEFCDELLAMEPEALGGEMEGAGMYASAVAEKVDWILVKAICDWGYDKDDKDQEVASRNAVAFMMHVIRLGGLAHGVM